MVQKGLFGTNFICDICIIRNKAFCENSTDPEKRPLCGRTYDISYDYKNSQMYIVDGHYHLCVVGKEGGYATQLATSVQGVPFKWLYAVTVDQRTGIVYFTDVSSIHDDRYLQIKSLVFFFFFLVNLLIEYLNFDRSMF